MPDLQEVFRLATQKVGPDPGALDRQRRFQRRTATRRRLAVFAVAAAISAAAIALILVNRPGEDTTTPADTPSTVNPAEAEALQVATGFLRAFGAFNSDKAMTYLADDADITGMTEGLGVEGLSLMTSFLQAEGYQQGFTSCEATSLASDTSVVCEFDFHAIRSDEVGRGPFSGSTFDLIVRDGEVVRASMYLETEEYGPQMWEPFAEWVSTTHPKDIPVMYNPSLTNFRLNEGSIRLWEQRTREYAKEVQRGTVGQSVQGLSVDYVVDLNSGEMTPLSEAIIRSLGETAEGAQAESQYAASPDGSQLAYVATGQEGSSQIFIVGIDGTGIRQLTHDPVGADSPAWSPDGTMIAYVGGRRSDVRDLIPGDLFVLDVATDESTQIADGASAYSGLQFTPDGSSLVYTGGTAGQEMRIVPVAGGPSTVLFGDGHGGMGHAAGGSFSPDGSLVTMTGHEVDGPGAAVFVSNRDGTQRRAIAGYGMNPAGTWSPDGSQIVCLSYEGGRILVVDIATGDASPVAKGSEAIWLDDHTLVVEA